MHPLVWLAWRDSTSGALGLLRRLKRPRGALAAAGLLLFCAVVASTGRAGGGLGENLPAYGAPALMALVLLGAFSPLGLYFSPADVSWLLAAPVSRRALVLYNVALRARPALFSGLLLSLLPAWRGATWWGSFAGYTLVFLLLQISAQWIAGLRAWLALHAPGAARRALGVGVFALPLAGAAFELWLRPVDSFRRFALESWSFAVFGAPARPFLATLTAPDAWSCLASALLATAILAAAVAHLCTLRIPFLETALGHSERRARRLARLRGAGGSFATSARSPRRVPMFPRLGGAGPVAWRQAQELVRNPRGILLILVIVAGVTLVCAGVPLLYRDPQLVVRLGRTGIFLVVMMPLLMGDNLACDFRRDLDRLGQLKSWPIAPLALAAGQIAPAALFATSVQALGVAVLASLTGAVPGWVAWLVVGLLPVVSWVALCIDNLFFLWMPYRTVPEDPGDVGFVGRTFATALFKFISLLAILGGTLALGWGALQLTGSPWGALLVPLASLLAACVGGTWSVAWAFQRFDVARDAPA